MSMCYPSTPELIEAGGGNALSLPSSF
ncbi:unnamed protein product [Amaranthus hypochondriacus]